MGQSAQSPELPPRLVHRQVLTAHARGGRPEVGRQVGHLCDHSFLSEGRGRALFIRTRPDAAVLLRQEAPRGLSPGTVNTTTWALSSRAGWCFQSPWLPQTPRQGLRLSQASPPSGTSSGLSVMTPRQSERERQSPCVTCSGTRGWLLAGPHPPPTKERAEPEGTWPLSRQRSSARSISSHIQTAGRSCRTDFLLQHSRGVGLPTHLGFRVMRR